MNIGATLAKTALTGGVGLLIGGRSRSKGKITVTWVKTADEGAVAPSPTSDSAEVLAALEGLERLKDAGILTDEEFESKKADLLARL